MSNRFSGSFQTLPTSTEPIGRPARNVESQAMLASRAGDGLDGETRLARPVACPLMSIFPFITREFSREMSNWSIRTARVSFLSGDRPPSTTSDCCPLRRRKRSTRRSPPWSVRSSESTCQRSPW